MEYIILILITISLFHSWKVYRAEVENADTVEEIRHSFVRLLLFIVLFIMFLIALIFFFPLLDRALLRV